MILRTALAIINPLIANKITDHEILEMIEEIRPALNKASSHLKPPATDVDFNELDEKTSEIVRKIEQKSNRIH